MNPKHEADKILTLFAHAKADVLLGKNLELHLKDIEGAIEAIHSKIDCLLIEGKTPTTHYEIGYSLYRLRDDILEQLKGD